MREIVRPDMLVRWVSLRHKIGLFFPGSAIFPTSLLGLSVFFKNCIAIRPGICFNYTGRKGWAGNQKSASETESAAGMATPTPALPDGFLAQFDCSRPDKAGGNNMVGDELAVRKERSAVNEGRRDRQLAPAERSSVSKWRASSSESISAEKPKNGGVPEGAFGGAFSTAAVSPPNEQSLNPYTEGVHAADSAAPDRGRDLVASAVVATSTTGAPAAESPASPPERFFVAYGHCLLAGAGTGASDEAAEAATAGGQSVAGDFGGASGRDRVSKKKRARGYGDALEVFQEGLRRFPTSAVLLYGAALAMQARVGVYQKLALRAQSLLAR